MDFKFCSHIHMVNQKNKPHENFGTSSRDHNQGIPKIFRAPIYGTHCAVIFAIAQLSSTPRHYRTALELLISANNQLIVFISGKLTVQLTLHASRLYTHCHVLNKTRQVHCDSTIPQYRIVAAMQSYPQQTRSSAIAGRPCDAKACQG